jgi:hypothetical protein
MVDNFALQIFLVSLKVLLKAADSVTASCVILKETLFSYSSSQPTAKTIKKNGIS